MWACTRSPGAWRRSRERGECSCAVPFIHSWRAGGRGGGARKPGRGYATPGPSSCAPHHPAYACLQAKDEGSDDEDVPMEDI